jgi:hypothetical protein
MSFVVGEVTAPVTADSTSFEQAMGRVKEEGEKASQQVSNSFKGLSKSISDSMMKVGKSLTKYVTAPLLGAGVLAAKSAIDFESAFAGVRKTVNATEEEFAALEKGIRDMAMELPSNANEIAGVAEAAGQLGIANDNILGFTRTMIDLGEATNLSADQAATQLARLANITQMPQDQFDRLGSSIVTVGNNLATTEAEIVDMAMGLAGVKANRAIRGSDYRHGRSPFLGGSGSPGWRLRLLPSPIPDAVGNRDRWRSPHQFRIGCRNVC